MTDTSLNPYLFFNGNCAEAMRFYEQLLGGKLDLITVGQSPDQSNMPPGSEHLIMHARLVWGGGTLMASDDITAGDHYSGMKGFRLSLMFESNEEAQRVFDALAPGANVVMPISKTFWSEAFGMLDDRFGTPWMINGKPIAV